MIRWAKLRIRRERLPSLDEVEEARANVFFERIRATLEAKQFKPHDRMIDRLLDQGYASTDICSALIHLLQGGAPTPTPAAAAPAPAKVERIASPPGSAAVPGRPSNPAAEGGRAPREESAGAADAESSPGKPVERSQGKPKFDRPARTGREAGKTTLFLNVGRKQLITPADIVGKIAGVTRLPADVVGAIDIHQRHTLVDVADTAAEVVLAKLAGIKLKGVAIAPTRASSETT
jgi:ATP-dependent RNA helicase DeaD